MSSHTDTPSVIRNYIPFVTFLGTFLGENCEVVLHDTASKEHSVLAIANGHISGRSIGAPLTDLALKFLANKVYEKQDWVMGYTTRAKNGSVLHSATYFIKDAERKLLGILCLNMDMEDILIAREALEKMIKSAGVDHRPLHRQDSNKKAAPEKERETFPNSLEALTTSLITQVIATTKVSPERMTADEKMQVVSVLDERGVFLLKGAVKVVARHLAVSEATMYRYIQKNNEKKTV